MDAKPDTGAPPEWSDDETMSVLFSPFRESRNLNPSSWDKKLVFWRQAVSRMCRQEGTAVINAKLLPKKFERKGQVPFCLGVVVQDMIKTGKLRLLEDVLSAQGQTWTSWTYTLLVKRPIQASFNVFVKKPLLWTYGRLFGRSSSPSLSVSGTGTWNSTNGLSDEQYVVMEMVQHLGERIQQTYHKSTEAGASRIISMDTLRQACGQCCHDDVSFQVALSWLCEHKRCMLVYMDDEKVVVFAESDDKPCLPLTESELTVFKLHRSSRELHQQIEDLHKQMESLRVEAKGYLQRSMKMSAKNCLRRKKRLEVQQEKKEAAIENIQQLLSTISQAHSDKQVLDAYSSGVSAYKDLTKRYGLTTEAVDDVMTEVQDVLETQEDLDRSMVTTISPDDLTYDDLELELAGILDEEPSLPDVPQVEPHQEMIDSLCQMRLSQEDLPEVPTHLPGLPMSTSSPARPAGLQPVSMATYSPQSISLTTKPVMPADTQPTEPVSMAAGGVQSMPDVINTSPSHANRSSSSLEQTQRRALYS